MDIKVPTFYFQQEQEKAREPREEDERVPTYRKGVRASGGRCTQRKERKERTALSIGKRARKNGNSGGGIKSVKKQQKSIRSNERSVHGARADRTHISGKSAARKADEKPGAVWYNGTEVNGDASPRSAKLSDKSGKIVAPQTRAIRLPHADTNILGTKRRASSGRTCSSEHDNSLWTNVEIASKAASSSTKFNSGASLTKCIDSEADQALLAFPTRPMEWDVDDVCVFVRRLGFHVQAFQDYSVNGAVLCQLTLNELMTRFEFSESEAFALREALAQTAKLQIISCALCTIETDVSATRNGDEKAWCEPIPCGSQGRWLNVFACPSQPPNGRIRSKCEKAHLKLWFKPLAPLLDAVEHVRRDTAGAASVSRINFGSNVKSEFLENAQDPLRALVFVRLVPLRNIRRSRTKVTLITAEEKAIRKSAHPQREVLNMLRCLGVNGQKLLKSEAMSQTMSMSNAFGIESGPSPRNQESEQDWLYVGTLQSLVNNPAEASFDKSQWPKWENAQQVVYSFVWKVEIHGALLQIEALPNIAEVLLFSPTFQLWDAPMPDPLPLHFESNAPEPYHGSIIDTCESLEPVGLEIADNIELGQSILFKDVNGNRESCESDNLKQQFFSRERPGYQSDDSTVAPVEETLIKEMQPEGASLPANSKIIGHVAQRVAQVLAGKALSDAILLSEAELKIRSAECSFGASAFVNEVLTASLQTDVRLFKVAFVNAAHESALESVSACLNESINKSLLNLALVAPKTPSSSQQHDQYLCTKLSPQIVTRKACDEESLDTESTYVPSEVMTALAQADECYSLCAYLPPLLSAKGTVTPVYVGSPFSSQSPYRESVDVMYSPGCNSKDATSDIEEDSMDEGDIRHVCMDAFTGRLEDPKKCGESHKQNEETQEKCEQKNDNEESAESKSSRVEEGEKQRRGGDDYRAEADLTEFPPTSLSCLQFGQNGDELSQARATYLGDSQEIAPVSPLQAQAPVLASPDLVNSIERSSSSAGTSAASDSNADIAIDDADTESETDTDINAEVKTNDSISTEIDANTNTGIDTLNAFAHKDQLKKDGLVLTLRKKVLESSSCPTLHESQPLLSPASNEFEPSFSVDFLNGYNALESREIDSHSFECGFTSLEDPRDPLALTCGNNVADSDGSNHSSFESGFTTLPRSKTRLALKDDSSVDDCYNDDLPLDVPDFASQSSQDPLALTDGTTGDCCDDVFSPLERRLTLKFPLALADAANDDDCFNDDPASLVAGSILQGISTPLAVTCGDEFDCKGDARTEAEGNSLLYVVSDCEIESGNVNTECAAPNKEYLHLALAGGDMTQKEVATMEIHEDRFGNNREFDEDVESIDGSVGESQSSTEFNAIELNKAHVPLLLYDTPFERNLDSCSPASASDVSGSRTLTAKSLDRPPYTSKQNYTKYESEPVPNVLQNGKQANSDFILNACDLHGSSKNETPELPTPSTWDDNALLEVIPDEREPVSCDADDFASPATQTDRQFLSGKMRSPQPVKLMPVAEAADISPQASPYPKHDCLAQESNSALRRGEETSTMKGEEKNKCDFMVTAKANESHCHQECKTVEDALKNDCIAGKLRVDSNRAKQNSLFVEIASNHSVETVSACKAVQSSFEQGIPTKPCRAKSRPLPERPLPRLSHTEATAANLCCAESDDTLNSSNMLGKEDQTRHLPIVPRDGTKVKAAAMNRSAASVALLSRFVSANESSTRSSDAKTVPSSSLQKNTHNVAGRQDKELLESLAKIRNLEIANRRLMEALAEKTKVDERPLAHATFALKGEGSVAAAATTPKKKRKSNKKRHQGKMEQKAALKLAASLMKESHEVLIDSPARLVDAAAEARKENELNQDAVQINSPRHEDIQETASSAKTPKRNRGSPRSEPYGNQRIGQNSRVALVNLEMSKSAEKARALSRALRASVASKPDSLAFFQPNDIVVPSQVLRSQADRLRYAALAWADSGPSSGFNNLDAYSQREMQRKLITLSQVMQDLEAVL